MNETPKHMVAQAVKVINEVFGLHTPATLIDWSAEGDGYAINVEETGLDVYDIVANGTVHGALPRKTFLEPINSVSLRLVRVDQPSEERVAAFFKSQEDSNRVRRELGLS